MVWRFLAVDRAKRQPVAARGGNRRGDFGGQRSDIECQPVGEQFQATLAPATLITHAGDRSLARPGEQGFELGGRGTRACRE